MVMLMGELSGAMIPDKLYLQVATTENTPPLYIPFFEKERSVSTPKKL